MEIRPVGKNDISFPMTDTKKSEIRKDMVYDPTKEDTVPKWTMSKYGTHVDVFVPSSRFEETNEEDNGTDTSSLDTRSLDECDRVAQKILEVYKIQRVRM